jgi:hypothetical protein
MKPTDHKQSKILCLSSGPSLGVYVTCDNDLAWAIQCDNGKGDAIELRACNDGGSSLRIGGQNSYAVSG